jgi:hypothetical protein
MVVGLVKAATAQALFLEPTHIRLHPIVHRNTATGRNTVTGNY